ncbi:MAG: hypothetical protein RSF82_04590 [Angelakisella sp.]
MNKTLKTVLITTAVIFVILFAVVMIFGEDTSVSTPPSEALQQSTAVAADQELDKEPDKEPDPAAPAAVVSDEMFAKTVNYDVFDWNGTDEQGKIKIANDIISVWVASGNAYERTAEDLAAGIKQELQRDSDQANVFEKACIAAQIDPLPYFERAK